jgi:transcriptional regulator with PAS, ATPase and Fis domain
MLHDPETPTPTLPISRPSDDQGIYLPSLDLEKAERLLIREALLRAGGNRSVAAGLLGMNLRTLQRRLAGNPSLLQGFRTRLALGDAFPE